MISWILNTKIYGLISLEKNTPQGIPEGGKIQDI